MVIGVGERVPAGPRVDRGEAVAGVVCDVEGLEVVRRNDVLRQAADGEVPHDPVGAGIDHVHRVRLRVRNVDQGAGVPGRTSKPVRAVRRIDVTSVEECRGSRHRGCPHHHRGGA